MRIPSSQVLFLALLPACASYPTTPTETSLAPTDAIAPADRTFAKVIAQEQDYSIGGLFDENHGEFVQNMNPYKPNLRASFLYQPNSDIQDEIGEFDLWELGFDAEVAFPIDPEWRLILGAHGDTRRYEFSSGFVGSLGDENFNTVGLTLGLGGFLSDDLYVEGRFRPGLQSDFDGTLKSDDWRFFGDVIATWQSAPDLYLKLGVEVDDTFDDAPILPVLGASWLFDPQWRLDVLLPRYMQISYNPDPSWIFDLGLSLQGAEYFVRGPSSLGAPEVDIVTQELRLFLGSTLRLNDQLSVFGQLGATLAGDHDFIAPGGDSDGTLEPGIYFATGLGWTF